MWQWRHRGAFADILRRVRAVSLLVACSIASAGVAAAQPGAGVPVPPVPAPAGEPPAPAPAEGTATPPAQAPALTPPPPMAEARRDTAWMLYHEAFGALLDGRRKRAAELVLKLQREHAGHPAAVLAASSPLGVTGVVDKIRRPRREVPTSGATAELALFQTMHGLAIGIELCVVFECEAGEAYVSLALLGSATGAVVSLKALDNITSGQRALLNSGAAWGTFNAIMGIIAGEPSDDQTLALGLLAGQSAGIATGALLFSSRPTAGQVALANSGGQWGAVLVALTLVAASPTVDSTEFALAVLAGADAGIGMGAYLAKLWPEVSRAQTLVIDAGGIVGGVGGGGIGTLISGDTGDRTTAAMAALGAAAGLAATAYLTRGWYASDDGDGDGPRTVLMPAELGRGGLVGLAGTW